MAGVLDTLGQSVIPSIFSSLNGVGLVDTMTITASAETQDAGGGVIQGTRTNAYTSVPVSYEPKKQSGTRLTVGDKLVSVQEYDLTFPTHLSGSRINLDPAIHRLEVNARGNEPAKMFKIVKVRDDSGVVFECVCEREDA